MSAAETDGSNGRYLLDNRAPEAEERFDSLGALFNPWTFRHMEMLGIAAGWRCWEVGVGGPSIPRWLSRRVGPTGHVLATDIDVRWVQDPIAENVEVRRHDVAADPPPSDTFDLVHERLVLIHLPQREQALRRMVDCLRPGGWALLEDFDSVLQPFGCLDPQTPSEHLANKVRAAFRDLLTDRGADLEYGRRLPRVLRNAGLVDVASDAYLPSAMPEARGLERANVQQVRDGLIAHGHVTAEELDAHVAAVEHGTFDVAMSPLVSAWGRKA
jgi:SAM-dependent methyltransferase